MDVLYSFSTVGQDTRLSFPFMQRNRHKPSGDQPRGKQQQGWQPQACTFAGMQTGASSLEHSWQSLAHVGLRSCKRWRRMAKYTNKHGVFKSLLELWKVHGSLALCRKARSSGQRQQGFSRMVHIGCTSGLGQWASLGPKDTPSHQAPSLPSITSRHGGAQYYISHPPESSCSPHHHEAKHAFSPCLQR